MMSYGKIHNVCVSPTAFNDIVGPFCPFPSRTVARLISSTSETVVLQRLHAVRVSKKNVTMVVNIMNDTRIKLSTYFIYIIY